MRLRSPISVSSLVLAGVLLVGICEAGKHGSNQPGGSPELNTHDPHQGNPSHQGNPDPNAQQQHTQNGQQNHQQHHDPMNNTAGHNTTSPTMGSPQQHQLPGQGQAPVLGTQGHNTMPGTLTGSPPLGHGTPPISPHLPSPTSPHQLPTDPLSAAASSLTNPHLASMSSTLSPGSTSSLLGPTAAVDPITGKPVSPLDSTMTSITDTAATGLGSQTTTGLENPLGQGLYNPLTGLGQLPSVHGLGQLGGLGLQHPTQVNQAAVNAQKQDPFAATAGTEKSGLDAAKASNAPPLQGATTSPPTTPSSTHPPHHNGSGMPPADGHGLHDAEDAMSSHHGAGARSHHHTVRRAGKQPRGRAGGRARPRRRRGPRRRVQRKRGGGRS